MSSANPAQIGNNVQLHTLLRASGSAQYPDYSVISALLSANTVNCGIPPDIDTGRPACRWWQVAVHALEVLRETVGGAEAAALLALDRSTILNNATSTVTAGIVPAVDNVPDPVLSGRYSALKARVTFTDNTATQRVVECDIGGGATLSFYGPHVEVQILSPAETVVLPPDPDAAALLATQGSFAAGLVIDSWIQASAAPCDNAPIGRRAVRYPVSRNVANGVRTLFKLPAGAVEVQILENTGFFGVNLWQFVESPGSATAFNPGAVPPAVLTTGGGIIRIPGTARWLAIDPVGAQQVSVVFTLEY